MTEEEIGSCNVCEPIFLQNQSTLTLLIDYKQQGNISIQNILLLLPIIISLIAAIPAYLSLNDKEANIYHSFEYTPIKVPATLDESKILKLLSENGIPVATLTISIVNQGNTEAEEIKVSIRNTAEAESIWTNPTVESKPAWVNIPDLNNIDLSSNYFLFSIKNLAVDKIIRVYVGYKRNSYIYLLNSARKYGATSGSHVVPWSDIILTLENPNKENDYSSYSAQFETFHENTPYPIQIYYRGVMSQQVDNINDVKKWSKYDVFELPIKILIYGFAIILMLFIFKAAITNPTTINYFSNLLSTIRMYLVNKINNRS